MKIYTYTPIEDFPAKLNQAIADNPNATDIYLDTDEWFSFVRHPGTKQSYSIEDMQNDQLNFMGVKIHAPDKTKTPDNSKAEAITAEGSGSDRGLYNKADKTKRALPESGTRIPDKDADAVNPTYPSPATPAWKVPKPTK